MSVYRNNTRHETAPENNKADVASVQLLLLSAYLLSLAQLFIDSEPSKTAATIDVETFYVLCCFTYLSKWLRDVTLTFLSLTNKHKAYFLLPKILLIAQ